MARRKKFRRYWKAGFLFALVSLGVNFLLTTFSNYVGSLPGQKHHIEFFGSTITFSNPVQSEWIVITVIVAIASLIIVPWFYGNLIEMFYNELIIKKTTRAQKIVQVVQRRFGTSRAGRSIEKWKRL